MGGGALPALAFDPIARVIMVQIYASCVAIDGMALLLRGASGAGKSDLALRLIDAGAQLVADDRVDLVRGGDGRLLARAPQALAGLIEVRGLGILPVPSVDRAPLVLVVDLDGPGERLPLPACETLAGVILPRLTLDAFHASTPAKLRLAMAALAKGWPLVPGEAAWQAGTLAGARTGAGGRA
ncbi:HPr kinase/phosphorylase [Niveispirillum fermenti]|uniref:HPr kinase/phosphorylase n=1 Tax=Niveispirillum fermenti TaxID=1233113 RepID=UPI003A875FE0